MENEARSTSATGRSGVSYRAWTSGEQRIVLYHRVTVISAFSLDLISLFHSASHLFSASAGTLLCLLWRQCTTWSWRRR